MFNAKFARYFVLVSMSTPLTDPPMGVWVIRSASFAGKGPGVLILNCFFSAWDFGIPPLYRELEMLPGM